MGKGMEEGAERVGRNGMLGQGLEIDVAEAAVYHAGRLTATGEMIGSNVNDADWTAGRLKGNEKGNMLEDTGKPMLTAAEDLVIIAMI